MEHYDVVVVGAGWAGTIIANHYGSKGYKVLVIEKRSHIAGNMYDYYDNNRLLVHKYGPHIVMTNNVDIVNFIKKYDEIVDINVVMEAYINGKVVPLPINFNSILKLYNCSKAFKIIQRLTKIYGEGEEINIIELLKCKDKLIVDFAKEIYDKVFIGYNKKMWGGIENVDLEIIGRTPIRLSYNDIRSKKSYNFVPKHGYTKLFEAMLKSTYIDVWKNKDALELIKIEDNKVVIEGKVFDGKVYYTGPIDALFGYKYGELPYRSVYFKKEIHTCNNKFNGLAITFPNNYTKFRTSDMSRVTGVERNDIVAFVSEYAGAYSRSTKKYNVPSYPIINNDNLKLYNLYNSEAKKIDSLICIGRLAEYKYYDMGQVIEATWDILNC